VSPLHPHNEAWRSTQTPSRQVWEGEAGEAPAEPRFPKQLRLAGRLALPTGLYFVPVFLGLPAARLSRERLVKPAIVAIVL